MEFLDVNGLEYFWQQIVAKIGYDIENIDLSEYVRKEDLPDHSNYIKQVYLSDDGNGNITLVSSSEAAISAEGVDF